MIGRVVTFVASFLRPYIDKIIQYPKGGDYFLMIVRAVKFFASFLKPYTDKFIRYPRGETTSS